MKLLISGGMGFIGSTFIKDYLKNNSQDEIINVDNLSMGSNIANLSSVSTHPHYQFIKSNIQDSKTMINLVKDVDVIINFAAETHVDRSIANPNPFVETNIVGTYILLEAARLFDKFFLHVSTDEVYGESYDKTFTEYDKLNPSNPYSATKASAEHLVESYHKTYKLKTIITRCTNNFGPYQNPEKLIPKTIIRALKGLKIPLYGSGDQIRSWIYVLDHVRAIQSLLTKGKAGEIYNITAWNEVSNKSIVKKILDILELSEDLIEMVPDRPSHDRRYSIDSSKIRQMTGWVPQYDLDDALEQTVAWYKNNHQWWQPLADEKTLHQQPWTLSW